MKLTFSLLLGGLLFCCCGNQSPKKEAQPPPNPESPLFELSDLPQDPIFDIHTTSGVLRVKLFKETPGHRDNFSKLVADGYYNGIIFHRIITGFMIQAGNTGETPTPIQLEYGGLTGVNYTIPAEIIPGITHKRGSIAAARLDESVNPQRASSGSQFYIVHTDNGALHLNGKYTIFGEVINGFEVIDQIANEEVTGGQTPVKPPIILSITPVL